jgi:hypothetical protein
VITVWLLFFTDFSFFWFDILLSSYFFMFVFFFETLLIIIDSFVPLLIWRTRQSTTQVFSVTTYWLELSRSSISRWKNVNHVLLCVVFVRSCTFRDKIPAIIMRKPRITRDTEQYQLQVRRRGQRCMFHNNVTVFGTQSVHSYLNNSYALNVLHKIYKHKLPTTVSDVNHNAEFSSFIFSTFVPFYVCWVFY